MGTYDGSLQMFINAPKDIDMHRLVFMRWLAEHGKLEHGVAGESSGPLVVTVEASSDSGLSAAA
jgi:hypothetical protein